MDDDEQDAEKSSISHGVSGLIGSTLGAIIESMKGAASTVNLMAHRATERAAEPAPAAVEPDAGIIAERTNEQVYDPEELMPQATMPKKKRTPAALALGKIPPAPVRKSTASKTAEKSETKSASAPGKKSVGKSAKKSARKTSAPKQSASKAVKQPARKSASKSASKPETRTAKKSRAKR